MEFLDQNMYKSKTLINIAKLPPKLLFNFILPRTVYYHISLYPCLHWILENINFYQSEK